MENTTNLMLAQFTAGLIHFADYKRCKVIGDLLGVDDPTRGPPLDHRSALFLYRLLAELRTVRPHRSSEQAATNTCALLYSMTVLCLCQVISTGRELETPRACKALTSAPFEVNQRHTSSKTFVRPYSQIRSRSGIGTPSGEPRTTEQGKARNLQAVGPRSANPQVLTPIHNTALGLLDILPSKRFGSHSGGPIIMIGGRVRRGDSQGKDRQD